MKKYFKKIQRLVIPLIISGRFGRNFWSLYIARGQLRYKFDALYNGTTMNRKAEVTLFNFRRNIHRLEKGLSFDSVRQVFAEDYIEETVAYLKQAKNGQSDSFDADSIDWGEAVLAKYFQVCNHTPRIESAYKAFCNLQDQPAHPDWIPYNSIKRPLLPIDYKSLMQMAQRRRSIRSFHLDKAVEPEVIRQAMAVAAQSPSACNRQSFQYLFFNDPRIVKKLSAVPGGISGYELPSIIVVIGCYRGYFDPRDINAPLIDASLSIMAFLFALETLGLSSVCVNWPNLPDRETRLRDLIHLEPDEFVVMMIGVGYAKDDGKVPYSKKRPLDDLLLINEKQVGAKR